MDGNSCPTGPSSCTKPFVYSPIDEVNSQVTAAAPLYYAMLFISRAGVGNTLSTTVSSGNLNVFAHAVSLDSGGTNGGDRQQRGVGRSQRTHQLWHRCLLGDGGIPAGPLVERHSGVTFAESGVSAAGEWTAKERYKITVSGSSATVVVPPASVALLQAQ